MRVTDHLNQAKSPLISFEIIPPKRGGDIKGLLSVIEDIAKYKPPFIDITSHAAEVYYDETETGIQKIIKRKRPGTIGICALIQNKYDIDAVPHILCKGFTREETEDFLIELSYLGIENVLAIRGDDNGYNKPVPAGRSVNVYAGDLVAQIAAMNQGKYLEEGLLDARPSNFCVGISGYPEKHFESPNIETDIMQAKKKVEAGADYIVTQMFYDNKYYYSYVEKCRAAGITVPIIPGLKILAVKSHLTTLPRDFYINIPLELSAEVLESKPDHVLDIGVDWAVKQVTDLLDHGVPAIHFYIMQNSRPVSKLMDKLKLNKKIF